MRRTLAAVAAIALTASALIAASPAQAATGDPVLVNELYIDHTGTDDTEFVELIGTPGLSLDGLSLIAIEADAGNPSLGNIDDRFDLGPDDTIGDNGYFLIGNPDGLGTRFGIIPDLAIATNTLENSSTTFAVVETASLGGALGDIVVLDGVHVTDADHDPAQLGVPSVGPDGTFLPAGVHRVAEGVDTDAAADWAISSFAFGPDVTPMTGHVPPEPTPATIMEIQGATHVSPLDGELIVTSGVVTARAFNGFYLQDPVGDGDDATSDAVFVFTGSFPSVGVGDTVDLVGTVSEFIPGGASTGNLSTTQLSVVDLTVTGAAPVPAPTIIGLSGRVAPNTVVISDDELPVNLQDGAQAAANIFDPAEDGIDFYESMEAMLVTVEDAQAVSATRRFGRFSAEFFTIPNQGATVDSRFDLTPRGGIFIDADTDGYGDLNPERVQIQLSGTPLYPGDMDLQVAVGDLVGDVTGVVGYSFGNFEVNALHEIDVASAGLEPESTSLKGSKNHMTVASYNVLNLSVAGRGDTAQAAKIAAQVVDNMNSPDVIALQEIQDDSAETNDGTTTAEATLQMLVDAIAAAGGPTYRAFDVAPVDGTQGGVPGGNIRTAMLYNPDRVDLVDYQALDADLLTMVGADPTAFDGTRVPLIGQFEFDGSPFTVMSVHASSRFGSTPIFGGPQPFVQAGEAQREAEMSAINAYVDHRVAADPDAQIVVAGDMNTFEFTDELLEDLPGPEPALQNLVPHDHDRRPSDFYTFIFDGNSQVLDHMFVTSNLLPSAQLDVVHVNVDFPRTFINTVASDHEPLVATLNPRS